MRQAITTKYLGPTNFRGARIKASCEAGSITVPWDHALDSSENHERAAQTLAHKWDWEGQWYGGGTESGYVFVRIDGKPSFSVIRPKF